MNFATGLMAMLFGSGRNVIAETAEVFRENAEAAGVREGQARANALAQFAAEFAGLPKPSFFDRLIDGLNRLPRPMMAYGVLGLFVVAMVDPVWFAARMQGLQLVPEPLWWLMGAIVSFYFGARYQLQGQRFQQSIAETMARVPEVQAGLRGIEASRTVERILNEAAKDQDTEEAGDDTGGDPGHDSGTPRDNPALRDWQHAVW